MPVDIRHVIKDCRMGLRVKPRFKGDRLEHREGTIVDVLPSGTAGLIDADGILAIKMLNGEIVLAESERFRSV